MDKYYDLRGMERQPVEATGPAEPVRSIRPRRRIELWHLFVALAWSCGVLALGTQGGAMGLLLAFLLASLGSATALYWYFRSALASASLLLLWVVVCCGPITLVEDMPRQAARFMQCSNNMKQLLLALHHYEQVNGSFPPAYVTDADGTPLYSWRVLILPYMEHDDLYRQFRLDEPWDSPYNLPLARQMPTLFHCPSGPPGTSVSPYVAVVDPATMWPLDQSSTLADISDGISKTVCLVEWPESDIVWTEPRDIPLANLQVLLPPTVGARQRLHSGGITIGMADGRWVRWSVKDYDAARWKAWCTKAGGEVLPEPEP